MSKNLYQDRGAWRAPFVNWQEFIFLPGDWLERYTYLLTYLLAYLLTYLLTYLLSKSSGKSVVTGLNQPITFELSKDCLDVGRRFMFSCQRSYVWHSRVEPLFWIRVSHQQHLVHSLENAGADLFAPFPCSSNGLSCSNCNIDIDTQLTFRRRPIDWPAAYNKDQVAMTAGAGWRCTLICLAIWALIYRAMQLGMSKTEN